MLDKNECAEDQKTTLEIKKQANWNQKFNTIQKLNLKNFPTWMQSHGYLNLKEVCAFGGKVERHCLRCSPGRQLMMLQAVKSLASTWEISIGFQVLDSAGPSPGCYRHLGSVTAYRPTHTYKLWRKNILIIYVVLILDVMRTCGLYCNI